MIDNASFLLLNAKRSTIGSKFRAWHDWTRGAHDAECDRLLAAGLRFISLSLYGSVTSPRYAAVMVDPALYIEDEFPVTQRHFSLLTASEFQETFEAQATQGFGPILISATGSFSNPRFAAVFEPQSPIALTRHRLRSGATSDENTIQGMSAKAMKDGLILRWAASYGAQGDEGFAAVWTRNAGNTVWNADGALETHSEYQSRFQAQTQAWCRPAFVTLNEQRRYLSIFVENEIGPWSARHAMTSASYQTEFNERVAEGFLPTCVQGAGIGSARTFAALFTKRLEPVPNAFSANGPVANAEIDDVIYGAMKDSPVWNASLAIVHGTELVYARGYTWGEPDWPLTQPTTRFRIASVSKLMGALGIHQLIQDGGVQLDDHVQDILQLMTPNGGAPADARFANITVRHLLEHTSGLDPSSFWRDIDIRDAFSATLPVTPQQTDSYMASVNLKTDPGAAMGYNNAAYYLLGRVLAQRRARATGFDALDDFVFTPLDMTRSRPSPSLLASMPSDEALYRSHTAKLGQSVMHADQRLVPNLYGTINLAKTDTAGGLSMAATDLGRIIALLLGTNDAPGFQRSTLDAMMDAAIANQVAWNGKTTDLRAGHGWDRAMQVAGGRYYGQKGGSLATSGNVLQLNGGWGFAMCWGGKASAASGWYPNYPAVMNIARNVAWSRDLFPDFGMSPLP